MSATARLTYSLVAASVLATGVYGMPKPLGPRTVGRTLVSRVETNYVGCSEDQKYKLGIAFADAVSLAGIGRTMDNTSTAFTHYLREEDKDNALNMLGMVAANNDPTNAPYSFSVRCAADDDTDCKAAKGGRAQSVAITDSQPDNDGHREMKICPLFFTAAETTRNLATNSYDGDKRGSWCQTGQKFRDFETGGHTLLHEMTHLDAIGKSANLPERDDSAGFKTHGTDDVDGFGDDYTKAARDLKDTWVNHRDDLAEGALQPFQNAESLAAAATEWWFLKSCGFTDINL